MTTKSLIGEVGVTRNIVPRRYGLALWLPLYRLQGSSFYSQEGQGYLCDVEGALWTPQGRTFDGIDDVISCGNNAGFTKASSFTLACWVKMTAAPASQYGLISKWDEAGKGYFLAIYNPGAGASRLILQLQETGHYKYVYGGTNLADDSYHFVVATYDGSDTLAGYKLYADAIEESYTTGSSGTVGDLTTTEVLRIGKRGATELPLAGTIGEVLVYNRALTPSEIQRIYLATKWRYRW